jgi:hypothetical protein
MSEKERCDHRFESQVRYVEFGSAIGACDGLRANQGQPGSHQLARWVSTVKRPCGH